MAQKTAYAGHIRVRKISLTSHTFSSKIFMLKEILYIEAWLSLVERCVRDAEVVGSNPVASTLGRGTPEVLFIRLPGFFIS